MGEEPWRKLKVGDRIRVVRMPSEFTRPGYVVAAMTKKLYRDLIARGRSLRIAEIDGDGRPLVSCRFRLKDGRWEYHYLAVDDDSWVQVRPRLPSPGKRK
jgi:hypothetical protein